MRLTVVGLGPANLDRVPSDTRELLADPSRRIIVRTLHHPAARQLADQRLVESCDDLYEGAGTFEEAYEAVALRVVEAASSGNVVYAVPGSPWWGELAVGRIRVLAGREGVELEVVPGESFVEAVLEVVGYDPLDQGLRILNGHRLPDPLLLDQPTIIGHLDLPVVLADVATQLDRVLPSGSLVKLVVGAGDPDVTVVSAPVAELGPELAGPRTSLFIPAHPGGLVGAIHTMRRLRRECPWDRDQTHHSLVAQLIE
ncbi:MAG: SAM-dependent methyltransferase, partial [Acidimicrobiia bacterium]